MGDARAIRYTAETKDGSSSIDVVMVELSDNSFPIGYDEFKELFGLEIGELDEIEFKVKAELVPLSTPKTVTPCRSNGCNQEAINDVFWPGQATKACAFCTVRLEKLADTMGFKLEVRPIS